MSLKVKADIIENRLYFKFSGKAEKDDLDKLYTDVRFLVADLKNNHAVVYPNPTKGIFNIDFNYILLEAIQTQYNVMDEQAIEEENSSDEDYVPRKSIWVL